MPGDPGRLPAAASAPAAAVVAELLDRARAKLPTVGKLGTGTRSSYRRG